MNTVTVEYNLSPVDTDQAIRDKLKEMGWIPPEEAQSLKARWQSDALESAVEWFKYEFDGPYGLSEVEQFLCDKADSLYLESEKS